MEWIIAIGTSMSPAIQFEDNSDLDTGAINMELNKNLLSQVPSLSLEH